MLRAFVGGRLFGTRLGTGSPRVLALHGWGRTHTDMEPVVAGLDALVLDMPGFGASPEPSEAWGSTEYAEAIAPVLDDMATPIVVVGHSRGGCVAVELAALRPEQVSAVVLAAAPLLRRRPPKPSLRFRALRYAHRFRVVSEMRLEAARQRFGSADYRATQGIMRGVITRMLNEDHTETLRSLRCPVELVWADADGSATVAMGEEAVSLVSDGKLTVVAGGHFAPLASAELRQAIERHLT